MTATKFKENESFKEASYRKSDNGFKGEVIQYQIKQGQAVRLWSYICKIERLTKEDAIEDAIIEKKYC